MAGVIEYWSADAAHATPKGVTFRYKTDTDLYAIAKARASPTSLAISPDGEYFALTATDFKVRRARALPYNPRLCPLAIILAIITFADRCPHGPPC